MGGANVAVGSSILPPSSVLSTWPAPNYIDPVTRSDGGLIICSMIASIVVICVALRLWTRAFVLRSFGLDDWLIAWAVMPFIGLAVLVVVMTEKYQFKRHVWDVPTQNFVPAYKLGWILQLCYCYSVNPTKISVLLFYQRLTSHTINRKFLFVVRATIVFMILHMIAFTLFLLLECHPIKSYWTRYSAGNLLIAAYNPSALKNPCINEGGAVFGMSVPQIFTDLLTTLLPNLLLRDLNISRPQKLKLALLFAVGYVVTIVGTVRVVYTWKYLYVSWDRTWAGDTLLLWTELEASFVVLCACAPALNALYTKLLGPKVRDLASSVRARNNSRRRSRSLGYAEMGGKHPFSATATGTTVSSEGESFVKPKDIEMADVRIHTIEERR